MAKAATPQPRNIGVDVPLPTRATDDPNCPFYGNLKVRGQMIVGRIVSTKMERTVLVEREIQHFNKKFERYERRTRRYPAHLPGSLDAKLGDEVLIMECRPISKTKAFVVVHNRTAGVAS